MVTPLFEQARTVLEQRYGMVAGTLDDLALLVHADPESPRSAALSVVHRCSMAELDRADCLLMLEICALELMHRP